MSNFENTAGTVFVVALVCVDVIVSSVVVVTIFDVVDDDDTVV